jgi:hypothetical protein
LLFVTKEPNTLHSTEILNLLAEGRCARYITTLNLPEVEPNPLVSESKGGLWVGGVIVGYHPVPSDVAAPRADYRHHDVSSRPGVPLVLA